MKASGSVLAPMLFNLYTNDQPTPRDTKHFLYADDLAITAQDTTFDNVKNKLKNVLKVMNFYDSNQLKPNQKKNIGMLLPPTNP